MRRRVVLEAYPLPSPVHYLCVLVRTFSERKYLPELLDNRLVWPTYSYIMLPVYVGKSFKSVSYQLGFRLNKLRNVEPNNVSVCDQNEEIEVRQQSLYVVAHRVPACCKPPVPNKTYRINMTWFLFGFSMV